MSRHRLCYVVASEMTVKAFLLEHIRAAAERYDVAVVVPRALQLPVKTIPVTIERRIAPIADLKALSELSAVFRRERFDLVHSVTPKAGLLAALAGALARVPVRLHTFTGQVWATRDGAGRALLKACDRLTARLATRVLADSASQLEFLVAEGVVDARKARVLGHGSVNGVDPARFKPDAAARGRVRARHGIPDGAVLFLYLGRLARDKGLADLARAFSGIGDAWLLLVGPDEDGIAAQLHQAAGASDARMRIVSYTDQPEEFMAAADVFVLPSYREGFGSVILEAAAAGVPAIGTRIYGVTDAIVDGTTGFLAPPRDPSALATRMRELAADAALRERLGRAARERALRDFAPADLTRALLACYDELFGGDEAPPAPGRGRSKFP
ncbi:MAG: glycosyltransferase family 4 protein [Pseudomonadota bacterium]